MIRLQDFLEILYKNISIENCRDILDKERIDKSSITSLVLDTILFSLKFLTAVIT